MELSGPPTPGDTNSGGTNSGGTNSGGGISMPMVKYTTNDLYLQIAPASNGTPGSLVIYTPWYVTNGVYHVLTTTNLAPPIAWQRFTNTAPGQTNIPLPNTNDPQRFFALGCTNSSAGTDFWFAYLANGGQPNLSLYISSQETAVGTVIMPGLSLTNSFSLAPGTATNINLTSAAAMLNWDEITTNGIYIVSSAPVSVYGLAYELGASDSFAAYPTPMLGTEYLLMARPSYVSQDFSSQFAIVGTASNTTVNIFPSATADLATNTGSNTLTITLQPGSTYEIYSRNDYDDVTGTIITSDHPIAVFAGANRAYVPDGDTTSANPLVQEQIPVAAWGTQALSLSFGRPGGGSFRILSVTNTTVVITTNNGVLTANVTGGQPYDVILDGPIEFQANNPIQVAQFALGGDYLNYNRGFGDPCEILLPPAGHYLTSYTIASGTNDGITGAFDFNYLNLIVAQSATSNTFVDDTNVASSNFVAIGGSGYAAARISVPQGSTNTIRSSQPVQVQVYGFASWTNGFGGYDAYGYIGGLLSFP